MKLRLNQTLLLTASLALILTSGAQAQTVISWSGASNTTWATNGNWDGGTAPANDLTTNIAQFDSAFTNQPNAGTTSIAGIQVTNGRTTAFTITTTNLSIGASGVTVDSGAGQVSLNQTSGGIITLGDDQTWTNNSTNAVLVNRTVAFGAKQLTIDGTGDFTTQNSSSFTASAGSKLILASTYGGTFTLSGTTYQMAGVEIKGGTLAHSGSLGTIGTISLGNTSGTAGANLRSTYTSNQGINLTVESGSSGVKKIIGAASGTGSVTYKGGGSTFAINGDVTLETSTSSNFLNIGGSGTGTWSGAGKITVAGPGTIRMGGAGSSFTSAIDVTGGTLAITEASPFTVNNVVAVGSGASFDLNALATTIAGLNNISGSGGSVANSGASDRILTLGGSGSYSFSGNIAPATASRIALTKTGTGTQALGGNNTYSGTTTVSGGTLLVNGTHIHTGSNGYSVTGTDTTLGGTGRIAVGGNISMGSQTILAPGASIGTLTLDGINRSGAVLTMATGSKFAFELAGNGGTPDQLSFWNYVSGDLGLNNNAIDLTLSGPVVAGTYTVNIFNFFNDNGSTATTHAFSSGLTIGSLGTGITSASIDWNGAGDNNENIALTYTVIPEPSSFALLAGGLAALAFLRRRRNV